MFLINCPFLLSNKPGLWYVTMVTDCVKKHDSPICRFLTLFCHKIVLVSKLASSRENQLCLFQKYRFSILRTTSWKKGLSKSFSCWCFMIIMMNILSTEDNLGYVQMSRTYIFKELFHFFLNFKLNIWE